MRKRRGFVGAFNPIAATPCGDAASRARTRVGFLNKRGFNRGSATSQLYAESVTSPRKYADKRSTRVERQRTIYAKKPRRAQRSLNAPLFIYVLNAFITRTRERFQKGPFWTIVKRVSPRPFRNAKHPIADGVSWRHFDRPPPSYDGFYQKHFFLSLVIESSNERKKKQCRRVQNKFHSKSNWRSFDLRLDVLRLVFRAGKTSYLNLFSTKRQFRRRLLQWSARSLTKLLIAGTYGNAAGLRSTVKRRCRNGPETIKTLKRILTGQKTEIISGAFSSKFDRTVMNDVIVEKYRVR